MDKDQLPKLCDGINAPTTEKDLFAISNYFKEVCAPGAWVPEKDKDLELSEKLYLINRKMMISVYYKIYIFFQKRNIQIFASFVKIQVSVPETISTGGMKGL